MPIPATEKPKKLLDLVRESLRVHHYSIRTEKTYVNWIIRYIYTLKPNTSANRKLGLFIKDMFHYDSEKDEYSCPANQRLQFRSMLNENGRWTRYYVTPACRTCPLKSKCTRGEQRSISRWPVSA